MTTIKSWIVHPSVHLSKICCEHSLGLQKQHYRLQIWHILEVFANSQIDRSTCLQYRLSWEHIKHFWNGETQTPSTQHYGVSKFTFFSILLQYLEAHFKSSTKCKNCRSVSNFEFTYLRVRVSLFRCSVCGTHLYNQNQSFIGWRWWV